MAYRAFCFIHTVAGSVFSDGLGICNFAIVRIDNCFHIWQAAIAYPYSISVKYFMELVVRWEMLI